MKLAIVISSNDPETVFNALRLANFAAKEGDNVAIFLMGKGVELDRLADSRFDTRKQARDFLDNKGQILACGTCLELRKSGGSEICPLSTMRDLHHLIRESDKVVSF